MKFRGRALQKMREPDELDRPIALVGTREWTALLVIVSAVLGAAIWAFTGSLPFTVDAPGVLTSAAGNRAIVSSVTGTVAQANVQPGQRVQAGDPLLTLAGRGTTERIAAPVDGTVLNLAGAVGESVTRGEVVATVQVGGDKATLVAQVFVPTAAATSMRPGIDVQLAVEGFPQARYGLLKGTVSSVAKFPIDPSMAVGIVGSQYVADSLTKRRTTVPVTVRLTPDNTASGFAWTSVQGPPFPVTSQHLVTVTFRMGNRTPFDVILGTS